MNLFDRILKRAHAWAQRVDRRLAEPAFKKKAPPPPPPPLEDCGGCLRPLREPGNLLLGFYDRDGIRYHGEDCYLTTPTLIRNLRAARYPKPPPTLAGDPR